MTIGATSGTGSAGGAVAGEVRPSLAAELKERTAAAHARAERHEVQGRLVSGRATREEYGRWLGQMRWVWRAVDVAVSELARRDRRVAAMLRPHHAHAARVESDLRVLGTEGGVASSSTRAFADRVGDWAAAGDVSVLGVWYVLEGSTNGGKYIAKALARGLGLSGTEGLSSLDPYGEAQREHWMAWRSGLDGQEFTDSEREAIVRAAEWTFDSVYRIMEDLSGRDGVERATPVGGV